PRPIVRRHPARPDPPPLPAGGPVAGRDGGRRAGLDRDGGAGRGRGARRRDGVGRHRGGPGGAGAVDPGAPRRPTRPPPGRARARGWRGGVPPGGGPGGSIRPATCGRTSAGRPSPPTPIATARPPPPPTPTPPHRRRGCRSARTA